MQLKDETGDKKYFTIIPNYIANHSSANDQALYLQMKKIVGEQEGICYASEKYFKDKLKIGGKALKKSIKYLISHGWIKDAGTREIQTKGGVQKSNVYLVKDIWEMNIEYYKGVSESEHLNNKGVAEREPLEVKGVSESNSRGVQKEPKGVAFEQQRRTVNKNIEEELIYMSYKKQINNLSRLTPSSKEKIKTRLKEYTTEQLLQAIDKFAKSDWWMEHNASRGVAWFFHSEDRIDQFLNIQPNESKIELLKVKGNLI